MKILHQIESLNRNDGGPTRSVQGLCRAQAALGHEVTLICNESDLSTSEWPFSVYQFHGKLHLADAIELCSKFEIVHLHGIWLKMGHFVSVAARKSGVPFVVHPRGYLQDWAIRQKKWKKRLAWFLYQKKDLEAAKMIIATAKIEETDVLKRLPNARVALLPNGIENQGHSKQFPSGGPRRALFISRIHIKKGIVDLLNAWEECHFDDWELIIAGPDSYGLWNKLEKQYPLNEMKVSYLGSIDGCAKADLFRSADLLIFPTYSENFGLVVAESLSVGTPVLTTNGTPWSNLQTVGCGWCIDPGEISLKMQLHVSLRLSKQKLFEMGTHGVDYIHESFDWDKIARQSIAIYKDAINC